MYRILYGDNYFGRGLYETGWWWVNTKIYTPNPYYSLGAGPSSYSPEGPFKSKRDATMHLRENLCSKFSRFDKNQFIKNSKLSRRRKTKNIINQHIMLDRKSMRDYYILRGLKIKRL